jgi:DNA-binding NarL/FixJ family response regulator
LIEPKRVGIVHEHDVLRCGIAGCLEDDQFLTLVFAVPVEPPEQEVDVAIISVLALSKTSFDCPIVVVDDNVRPVSSGYGPRVYASVSLGIVTAEQLVAAVRAAAAGLRVETPNSTRMLPRRLDERRLAVLRLLASGETTRAISEKLCYSERTIKTLIRDVEYELSAHSRAQAVAEAMRHGLI